MDGIPPAPPGPGLICHRGGWFRRDVQKPEAESIKALCPKGRIDGKYLLYAGNNRSTGNLGGLPGIRLIITQQVRSKMLPQPAQHLISSGLRCDLPTF